ncbi:MAG: EAL domain-containing protein, partial [Clostridiales bacterium]|nr:EAL domain-containing protein [Clostridiales bacterium]
LKDKDFVKIVENCISEACLDPSCIEHEITESVFISSMQSAIAKLAALRKIGVRVALDDFGKGYSSLSYLKNLPINTLKIDKTFTDEIDFGSDRNMVSSIIALVHNLEIETIAEGVETQGQYDYLLEAGCDYVQGYLTGRPETEEVVCRLLTE